MLGVYRRLKELLASEDGQDLVEYSLMIALIAFGAVTAMQGVTHEVIQIFNSLSSTFSSSLQP